MKQLGNTYFKSSFAHGLSCTFTQGSQYVLNLPGMSRENVARFKLIHARVRRLVRRTALPHEDESSTIGVGSDVVRLRLDDGRYLLERLCRLRACLEPARFVFPINCLK